MAIVRRSFLPQPTDSDLASLSKPLVLSIHVVNSPHFGATPLRAVRFRNRVYTSDPLEPDFAAKHNHFFARVGRWNRLTRIWYATRLLAGEKSLATAS